MEPANAQGKWLKRLWSRLPNGTLTEPELDAAILKHTNAYEHDHALAKTIRVSLLLAHAVTTEGEDGKPSYRKAEAFPERSAYNGPGSESFNAHLQKMAEAEEQRHREEDRAKAEAFEQSPLGIERQQRLDEIDQRVATAVRPLRDELGALRAEIAALREQLAVTEVAA